MPVDADFMLPSQGPVTVRADVLELGPVVRHDPDKLGPVLCDLATRRCHTVRTSQVAAGV
jgi:hypothetical protein